MKKADGLLAPLAIHQLREWERIADTWVIQIVNFDGDSHLLCPACDCSIFPVDKDGSAYIMTIEDIRARVVAHLRNRHRDLDPDKGDT